MKTEAEIEAMIRKILVEEFEVDPAALKPGKTRDDVIAALKAEGATAVFAGWGAPAFGQKLWNVSPERYRVESSEVVQEIIDHRIILADIRWIDAERKTQELLVEAFRKVMAEYAR